MDVIKESDYRLNPAGYMQHRTNPNRYMHRDVWAAANGPIPADHHIHHKNKVRSDNRIENLECMEKNAHLKLHGLTFKIINSWEARKRSTVPWGKDCISCDGRFDTINPKRAYCSHACNRKHQNWLSGIKRSLRREARYKELTCPNCSMVFKQNRPFQIYCTIPCQKDFTNEMKRCERAAKREANRV